MFMGIMERDSLRAYTMTCWTDWIKKGYYVRNDILIIESLVFRYPSKSWHYCYEAIFVKIPQTLLFLGGLAFLEIKKKFLKGRMLCKTLRNFNTRILQQWSVSFCTICFAFLLCYSEGQVKTMFFFFSKVIRSEYFLKIVFINDCVIVLLSRLHISALHFNEISGQDQAVKKTERQRK